MRDSIIWNYDNEVIYSSNDLIDNGLNNSFVVIPKPGDYNKYLIISAIRDDINGHLRKVEVNILTLDMNKNNGTGEITGSSIVTLYDASDFIFTFVLDAVRHANGRDIWLVLLTRPKVFSFLINKDGIDLANRKESPIGNLARTNDAFFDLKVSPNGKKIAAVRYNDPLNLPNILLCNFDNASGKVTKFSKLILTNPFGGLEFSPDSKKIYYSRYYDRLSDLYQVSIDSEDINEILNSNKLVLSRAPGYLYSMKLGPNGKIYYINGIFYTNGLFPEYLSVINNPNGEAGEVDIVEDAVYLNGRKLKSWLPYTFHDYIRKALDKKDLRTFCEGSTIEILSYSPQNFVNPVFSWTGPNGFTSDQPDIQIPNAQINMTGWYVLHLTSDELPDIIDSIYVEILPSPQPEIIPDGPLQFCEGGSIGLTLDKLYSTVVWTTGETTERITVTQSGSIGVTVSDSNGCEGYSEVEITVSDSLKPEIVGNKNICLGDSAVLSTKNKYYSYLWSTGDTTATITVNKIEEYYVRVTTEDGCSGTSDPFFLDIHLIPAPTIAPADPLCLGKESTYSIRPIPGGNIYWTLPMGGEIIGNSDMESVVIRWLESGTWELIVRQANEYGCTGYDTVNIDIEQTIFPKISPQDPILCQGGSLILSASEGYVKFLWSTDETTREIEITEIGKYSVIVTDENGCIGINSVDVVEADSIDVSIIADGDTEICGGGSIILSADKEYASYEWSYGESQIGTDKSVTITQPGRYELIVTNEEGCTGETFVDVTEIDAELKFADVTPVDFGRVLLGNNLIHSVLIINPSDYDIEYTARIKNNIGHINVIQANNIIRANNTNNITLTFTPYYPQYYYDTLIVEATDPCEITLSKAITAAGYTKSRVWLPDTIATPGTKDYCIPLRAEISNDYFSDLSLSYSATLNTDASLIVPDGNYSVIGRDLQIDLGGVDYNLTNNASIIENICGRIIFADEDVTPIKITGFEWSGLANSELVEVEIVDGSITIDGVCVQNIRRIGGFKLTEMQISPNPANQSINITIESGEVGTFELSIYSTEGIEIENYKWHRTKSSPEANEFNIDLTKISSGIYRIMLRSPMEIISKPLSVVK